MLCCKCLPPNILHRVYIPICLYWWKPVCMHMCTHTRVASHISLRSLFEFWGCSMFRNITHAGVCFKYSASQCAAEGLLWREEGRGREGEKERHGLSRRSGRRRPARVGCGREKKKKDRKVALLSTAAHPEEGDRPGGRAEEGKEGGVRRGLVGWRRRGSPAAVDTNTQEEIQRRQDGIRSDQWFHRCLRLIESSRLAIILTVHSVISAPPPPMCTYMHTHSTLHMETQTTTYIVK